MLAPVVVPAKAGTQYSEASNRLILRNHAQRGVSKDGAAPWFETALRASSP